MASAEFFEAPLSPVLLCCDEPNPPPMPDIDPPDTIWAHTGTELAKAINPAQIDNDLESDLFCIAFAV
jgi:hypothetical protein